MSKRKKRLAQQLGPFLQQYARPTNPNIDPNDRRYDRGVEDQVRRLGAEEFSQLLNSGEDTGITLQHALGIAEFVHPDARNRVRRLLRIEPGRVPDHWLDDLDSSCRCTPLEDGQTPARLEAILVAAGAPETCYALGIEPDMAGTMVPLSDGVRALLGGDSEAILSCVPGRLACYHTAAQWLLVRRFPAEAGVAAQMRNGAAG